MSRSNNSIREFTDYQVYTIIKNNPGLNPEQIVDECKKDMASFTWSRGKVRQSIHRLKAKGRVVESDNYVMVEVPCKTYFPA